MAEPLDAKLLNGLKLRLEGEHQYLNAGLAIALSFTWLQRTGHHEFTHMEQAVSLIHESFPVQALLGLHSYFLNLFTWNRAHFPSSLLRG